MRLPRVKMTVRRTMCLVAVVALAFGVADAVSMSIRSARYRRRADHFERMERRCREIGAMDDATRVRAAEAAFDDPFLDDPGWNRRMIPYFESLKRKYRRAALQPRVPLPPDPPSP